MGGPTERLRAWIKQSTVQNKMVLPRPEINSEAWRFRDLRRPVPGGFWPERGKKSHLLTCFLHLSYVALGATFLNPSTFTSQKAVEKARHLIRCDEDRVSPLAKGKSCPAARH